MKEYYLVIEDFVLDETEHVFILLKKILESEFNYIHITWKYYHTLLEKGKLHNIADIISRLGREKEFFVFNQIETDQINSLWKTRRWLNRYGMCIVIRINPKLSAQSIKKINNRFLLVGLRVPKSDYAQYRKYYEKFRICETELLINQEDLTLNEFHQWFEDWLHDRETCWISCFRNICSYVFTGVHMSDCQYNSCMGRQLCVDANGIVYFCTGKKAGSNMYRLNDQPCELYNEVYFNVLQSVNKHRNACKKECTFFSFCQGGCALEKNVDCTVHEYMDKIKVIQECILEHRKDQFTKMENPLLRQLLIRSVAYGFDVE